MVLVDIDLSLFSSNSLCALGSGWHYGDLQQLEPETCKLEYFPQAYDIAELARTEFDAGNLISPMVATPTYLRNEVKWRKQQRRRHERADVT